MGFELTTLVVIGTDCTGSCKSNYQTITTTPLETNHIIILIIILNDKRIFFNIKDNRLTIYTLKILEKGSHKTSAVWLLNNAGLLNMMYTVQKNKYVHV